TMSVMWALACTHWRWAFTGRAAHAAGDPDKGLNALDAFVHAYTGIAMWRQQLLDGTRVHGFIAEGGTAPNIIPERTSGEFLTRAREAAYLDEMNLAPEVSAPWARVGSTDVGDVSYACPTIHPEVAIIHEGVSCHTHEFREAAATEHAH